MTSLKGTSRYETNLESSSLCETSLKGTSLCETSLKGTSHRETDLRNCETNEYKEKAKVFLERQLKEYETRIRKLKKKRKVVKALFTILIIISITSSTACAALAGFIAPPFIIPTLSAAAGLSTAFSVKFNLQGKKAELNKTIDKFGKIKQKIDYVVSCNGNFTEAEYEQVILEVFS